MQGIYKITNLVNNKCYIGSSKYVERRYFNHFNSLLNKNHHSKHLQSSFDLYGIKNFSFTTIEIVEKAEDLLEREQFWIDFFNSSTDTNGYNIRKDASSNLGRKASEETKSKMRLARMGKQVSIETREKIAEANRGKKRSEETKEKMRKAKLGKKSRRRVPIYQIDLQGNFIKEWDSISEAAKVLKVSRTKIFSCLRKESNHHFDYNWAYKIN